MEFLPVIDPLTEKANTSTDKPVSFNVVVPSLPGIAFSTSGPGNWTLEDTARVFSTLMTDVLGYKTFAAHGTSNGAVLTFSLYDKFNTTTRAAHFPLLPFYSSIPEEIAALEIELSPLEQFEHERAMNWTLNGTSYSSVQILRVSQETIVGGKLTSCAAEHDIPRSVRQPCGAAGLDGREVDRMQVHPHSVHLNETETRTHRG